MKALRSTLVPIVACSAFIAGCSTSSSAQESAADPGLVREVLGFRAADGLFGTPGDAPEKTLLIDTAAFVGPLADRADAIDWQRAAANPLPPQASNPDVDAYLSISLAAGVKLTADQLRNAARFVTEPTVESDPGNEVGALWTWSHAVRGLGAQAPAGARGRILVRLTKVDAANLANSPYLALRLEESYRHIGAVPPPALQRVRAAICTRRVPEPTDLKQILDSIAIAACTAGPAHTSARTTEYTGRMANAADDFLARGEDFAAASALQVLKTAGAGSAIKKSTITRLQQRTRATGLLTASPSLNGSVRATYQFARLLDNDFARVSTTDTRTRLYAVANDSAAPSVTRLEAAVALRRSGDKRWKQFVPLAAHAWTGGTTIGSGQLAAYLAVMDPAGQLTDAAPKATLVDFQPADENQQRLATAAIALPYLFSNPDAVGRMFAQTQQQLRRWASADNPLVAQRVIAAAALPNAALAGADSTALEQAGRAVSELRGCSGSERLLRVAEQAHAPCSLELTVIAAAVPGAAS